jgi:Putative Ig domain
MSSCVSLASRAAVSVVVVATLLLGACGGEEDQPPAAAVPSGGSPTTPTPSEPPPTVPPAGGANAKPSIAGTPSTSVLSGNQYAFTPAAADPNGDTLTFSIAGRPRWATFNTATGQLRGTPTAADIGTYSGVTISVTDGSASATLQTFNILVVATASGSALVSWMPPTANTDGSPLGNLAGFKVYWGAAQGQYPNSATITNLGVTSFVVEQLTPGTWYFATTAFASSGAESAFSAAASKTIR